MKPSSFAHSARRVSVLAILITLAGCAHTALRSNSEPAGPTAANLPPGIVAPRALHIVNPMYPYQMKRLGVTGTVNLKCLIAANGNIGDIEVISATHAEFTDAAVEAVKRWTFAPGTRDGQPTAQRIMLPISFYLTD